MWFRLILGLICCLYNGLLFSMWTAWNSKYLTCLSWFDSYIHVFWKRAFMSKILRRLWYVVYTYLFDARNLKNPIFQIDYKQTWIQGQCNNIKPIDEFNEDATSKWGLQGIWKHSTKLAIRR